MAGFKEMVIVIVVLNIVSVYSMHTTLRGLQPVQRTLFNGLLWRYRSLRLNPLLNSVGGRSTLLRNRGSLINRGTNRNTRLRSLNSRRRSTQGTNRNERLRSLSSRRRSNNLSTQSAANLIASLKHPLLCKKGQILVCGEAQKGITIQRCYSKCNRKSCVVPCVCACFNIPEKGILKPVGDSVFLPLADSRRIPSCDRREILRCTAKRRTVAKNSQCASACMAGMCPALCDCRCIDERLKGQGIPSDEVSKVGVSTSPQSRRSSSAVAGGGKGAIIVKGSPPGGAASGGTETETIDVKIDVVKGGDSGSKGSGGKGGGKSTGGLGKSGGLLDPGLGSGRGGAGVDLFSGALGGNQLLDGLNGLGSDSSLANSLGVNDPVVLLDPTRQGQPVGKIDPNSPVGLSPGNTQNINAGLDNTLGSISGGNLVGGDLLSKAMQNLGGSVDFLDPSLANILPMALGQNNGGQSSVGMGTGNNIGQNNIAANDVLLDPSLANMLPLALGQTSGSQSSAGIGTGSNVGQNMVGKDTLLDPGPAKDALAQGVDAFKTGVAEPALNAGINVVPDVNAALTNVLQEPTGAKDAGGVDVSGLLNGGTISAGGINLNLGLNTGGTSNAGGVPVSGGIDLGTSQNGLQDAWGGGNAIGGSNAGTQTLNGGLKEVWGSKSASNQADGFNNQNLNTNTQSSGGLSSVWGTDTLNAGGTNGAGADIASSSGLPSVTSGQSADYCSRTGRRMWCKAGTTWKSTPGLTRWCNVNCPSGACDVERCLCNCVTPIEYERNFNKFIGF